MALYAFDGTWNEPDNDGNDDDRNTNVIKFAEHYAHLKNADEELRAMKADYIHGVGNRFGRAGRIVGGFVGAGGKERVREMIDLLRVNFENGDEEIDVVGFSRGAAIAVHFCNKLNGGVIVGGEKVKPMIRFLGLWDIVPAFGAPGIFSGFANEINIGWDLGLPGNVLHCAHAMALNETRQAFNVLRLDPKGKYLHVSERWFRGVHSDVGGGNGNLALSSIPLRWMMEQARLPDSEGLPVLPFGEEQLTEAGRLSDPRAAISVNSFGGKTANRPFYAGDESRLHPSAAVRLGPGESIRDPVDSKLVSNYAGILVEAGARYLFRPDPAGKWTDLDIPCDASGWPDEAGDDDGFFTRVTMDLLRSRIGGLLRRVNRAGWFEMCACPGFDDDEGFGIGRGQFSIDPWECPQSAPLVLFTNDCLFPNNYGNNEGVVDVTITRVS
jgi:hypothetical protein